MQRWDEGCQGEGKLAFGPGFITEASKCICSFDVRLVFLRP